MSDEPLAWRKHVICLIHMRRRFWERLTGRFPPPKAMDSCVGECSARDDAQLPHFHMLGACQGRGCVEGVVALQISHVIILSRGRALSNGGEPARPRITTLPSSHPTSVLILQRIMANDDSSGSAVADVARQPRRL